MPDDTTSVFVTDLSDGERAAIRARMQAKKLHLEPDNTGDHLEDLGGLFRFTCDRLDREIAAGTAD